MIKNLKIGLRKYIHSKNCNYKAVLRIFEQEFVEKSENSGDKAKSSVEKE